MTKFNMVEHHRERHCKNDKENPNRNRNQNEKFRGVERHKSKRYLGIFANEKTTVSMTLAN